MHASPEDTLKSENRSSTTFFEWFQQQTGRDFENDDPEEIRRFFDSRSAEWFADLNSAYHQFHEHYPGGFSVPSLDVRRPLLWGHIGTAGLRHTQGGIGDWPANFIPLLHGGVAYVDGIALPIYLASTRSRKEIQESSSHKNFLSFVDRLIASAPLFKTGQMAVVSEHTAFGIADPKEPYDNPWKIEEVDQDILSRQMSGAIPKEQLGQAGRIPLLLGYLNLAESYDLEPVISEEYVPAAALMYDYFSQIAYAENPENAFATIPDVKFRFHVRESSLKSQREIARVFTELVNDQYWSDLRSAIGEAAKEASLADFRLSLHESAERINQNKNRKPPAYVSLVSDVAQSLVGGGAVVGGIALFEAGGAVELAEHFDSNSVEGFLMASGLAGATAFTVKNLIARASKRSFVTPDVLRSVSASLEEPSEREKAEIRAMLRLARGNRQTM